MNYRAKEHYQEGQVARDYDRKRFSSWAGRLAHKTESEALRKMLRKYAQAPGKILDIPCGTARLFPTLLDQGFEVCGGDISEEMMSVAKEKYKGESRVSFGVADAEKLPFEDNAFDYLTSYRLMTHLPSETRDKVLGEMIRVTRKRLIINYHFSVLTPHYLLNRMFRPNNCPAYPVKEAELRSELEARSDVKLLEIMKLSWYDRSSSLVVLEKNK